MKRRLKIYFVHSLKYDYNNMLYRDLLTDSVLNKHELMLPMSNAYKEKYSKDLCYRRAPKTTILKSLNP